jgi:antitoxin component YwqK of YwqJK toxin-antitoxin module
MQDKKPYNEQGERHGYWEVYHTNGHLHYFCNYINDKMFGKYISYMLDGSLNISFNSINNRMVGYCEDNWVNKIYKSYHAR